jgi:hypothetical protein
MIYPITKKIASLFLYNPIYLNKLKYIKYLRLRGIKNLELGVLLENLEIVEELSLYGVTSNYEKVNQDDITNYKKIISHFYFEDNNEIEEYDGTCAGNVSIKSNMLNSLFMYGFTINKLKFPDNNVLEYLTMEDVYLKNNILYLNGLKNFIIDNFYIKPQNFNIKLFKFPK